MPENLELRARHRKVTPSWLAVYHDEPIAIDRGEGRTVWDVEGNEYLDFFGGILTTMVGHSIPEITAAVQEQAAKVIHTSTLYLSEPMIELAEQIAELSGIPDAKVFFTTSGTEANDAAMMLATAYRGSNQILALRNSYHGRSFTTVAITSHRSWSPTSISGLNVNYVHGGYRLRSPFRDLDDGAYIEASVADLQTQAADPFGQRLAVRAHHQRHMRESRHLIAQGLEQLHLDGRIGDIRQALESCVRQALFAEGVTI